jgi:hypothetical protein
MSAKKRLSMKYVAKAVESVGSGAQSDTVIHIGTGDCAVDVLVKHELTLLEKRDFINDVLAMVFIKPSKDVDAIYCPHMRDFAIDYCTVRYFTNIKMSEAPEEAAMFLYETGIIGLIVNALPNKGACVLSMKAAANDAIEYACQFTLRRGGFNKIAESISTMIDVLNDSIKDADLSSLLDALKDGVQESQEESIKSLSDAIIASKTK